MGKQFVTNRRELAEKRGRQGEAIAAWWLRLHGWRIVGQRLKTPRGEVDLIARRGKTIAFIEVKARVKQSDLATAIDGWRLRRVAAAAEQLLPRYGKGAENMRIDVILVAPWRWPHHLVNVWHG
ncbi:MAG TPA: YraN family protein [Sphingorhabdus sp.]|jgi:putative endonuclease|uniref:YraN family protein n=1 Tax=Sphingorhabdus sp. TaxID=1902408 RepID=UPI002B83669D|nr:YraN family protein [Sphingorhabdus sp.]HMT40159.1 YraN family protein [Sphingorhabdus sp.]HMU22059.1 YraN family protein [Sphingorhabdus sp.]